MNPGRRRELTPEHMRVAVQHRILVITGAGLSADSGLETFRGAGGLWRNYNPTELATPEAFARDPKLVWEWYQWRRREAAKALPNTAHLGLAELARRTKECLVVTQNVDNLHERAQTPADRLVHVHGDLFLNRCQRCAYFDRKSVDEQNLPRVVPTVLQVYCDLLLSGSERCSIMRCCGESMTSSAQGNVRLPSLSVPQRHFSTSQYIIDWALRARGQNGMLVEVNP